MCGLVAVLPGPCHSSPGPDPALLASALRLAGARGPHGYGVATWCDGNGWSDTLGWQVGLHAGVIPSDAITAAPRLPLTIAHGRLATSSSQNGGLPPLTENQPIVQDCTGWLIAHNGNSDHPALIADRRAPSDTRGLLAIVAETNQPRDLLDPVLYRGAPQAVLLAHPAKGVFLLRISGRTRPAHPVHLTHDHLLSSGPVHRSSRLLPSDELIKLRPAFQEVRHHAVP